MGLILRCPHAGDDADCFWHLWAGRCSPLFGKDWMASFEGYFVEDEKARVETKNPYFELIHDAELCRGIAEEMGAGRPRRAPSLRVSSRGDHHRRGRRPRGVDAAGSRAGYSSGR